MFTYDCLLAAVLLTGSVESTVGIPPMERLPLDVLRLAIDIEILDAREDQYLHGLSRDPHGDLIALRKRHQVLRLAPNVADADRFPPRKLAEDYLDANRAYRRDLIARLEVDTINAEALRTAIAEVDQLHHVWSIVRDFQCKFYYVAARRQSLQQLRALIGDAAFCRGDLPPHVPFWHFPQLK